MSFRERLVLEMKSRGYEYDELESCPHNLRFTSDSPMATYFKSWREVSDWLENA